jgi:hypothetical protein
MGIYYTCDICGKTEKAVWPCDCHERLAAYGLQMLVGARVEAVSLARLNDREAPVACLKIVNAKGESQVILISTHQDMHEQPYVGGAPGNVYEAFQKSAIEPASPAVLGIPDHIDVIINNQAEDSSSETDEDSDEEGDEDETYVPLRHECAYSHPQPVACTRSVSAEAHRGRTCSSHDRSALPEEVLRGTTAPPSVMGYVRADPPSWKDLDETDHKVFQICRPGQFTCKLTIREGWIRLGDGEYHSVTGGQSYTTDFKIGDMGSLKYNFLIKRGGIEELSGDAEGLYAMLRPFFIDVFTERPGNEVCAFRLDNLMLSVTRGSPDAGVTFNLVATK